MKIHAFCIIKNEADIIGQTLTKALTWCDYIYIFDNGSTDSTWEIVLELSAKYEQIIPYKQDDCPFEDSLRGQIFNFYRKRFTPGDWCCRLDADEVYVDNPRKFLSKVSSPYEVVCAAMFIYYFTEKDLEIYEKNPLRYAESVDVEDKLRYYQNSEAEIRFFKYREDLIWKEKKDCLIPSDYKDWPSGLKGEAYPDKIQLKNYRYRSPQQIQKRVNTRLASVQRGDFPQEMPYQWKVLGSNFSRKFDFSQWQSRIADSSELEFDAGSGKLVVREDLMLDTRSILIGYHIIWTPQNFLKEIMRKLKRNLVKIGLIKRKIDY
jgi:glycosyltransferase involved in cell wall biosynthesis